VVWEDADIYLGYVHKRLEVREDDLPYLNARVVSAWFAR